MKRTKLLTGSLLIAASSLFISQEAAAQKFTLAVLPDTQVEVGDKPEMFMSQMQWIAAKKDSLNIPFVLHVGDVVNFNNGVHYIRANEGFKLLDDAKIPYAISLGNHDTDAVGENSGSAAPGKTNTNLRITGKFNAYHPVSKFIAQKGRFEEYKSDNAYYKFNAGGLKWMVFNIEFCPRKEAVEWAGKIIAKNPKYNVIIVTHYFINGKAIIGKDNNGYGDMSPQFMYDEIVSKYPNVRMVLCGHTGISAYRDDIGIKGNHIYSILQDYQGQDKGGGYIRLLEIDPAQGTISAKMYSPYYNLTKDDASKFAFTGVKFVGKK
jgi:hypothetical protein